MKILSALFDSVLLPLSIAKDIVTIGGILICDHKSATRRQIEKIENELKS